MLVTLHHGLQLVLNKTIRIGDTKYHIKCSLCHCGNFSNDTSYEYIDKCLSSQLTFGSSKCQSLKQKVVIHSKLHSITHVATKVHVILHNYVMFTWIHDDRELV